MNGNARGGWRSGALARDTGVSADTLRHYERLGLLPKARRSPNGYRIYGPDARDRVKLVQRALALGFTLDEVARFLHARESGRPPCREVRRLAGERLAEVEAAVVELSALRDALRAVLADWDARLSRAPAGASRRPLHLLESLPTNLQSRPGAASLTSRRFSRRPGKERS
jgi:DNA-binding transcriptional MerR regulator